MTQAKETKTVRKTTEKAAKGKKVSWRPSTRLGRVHLPANMKGKYRTRWVKGTPDRVAQMQEEGWMLVNDTVAKGVQAPTDKEVTDGANLDSALRKREMVAMVIPEELAEARDKFYKEETEKQTQGVLGGLDSEASRMGVKTYAATGRNKRVIIE